MAYQRSLRALAGGLVLGASLVAQAADVPRSWSYEWPKTDFAKHSVPLDQIISGGPPKDGIPAIDDPTIVPIAEAVDIADTEPVVGLVLNGAARAYPLRILTWHEIVNDELGGVPVTVTYCPLCNSSIAFDRRLDGRVLDFGTSGKLRKSDLVMYDRQTESWWQQFMGEAIVGELTGRKLRMLPSRMESWVNFRKRAPGGTVLVPSSPGMRPYGSNPYVKYDSARNPFLYQGDLPAGIEPMVRVVAVGDQAWSMPLLSRRGSIEAGDLVLTWRPGQNSALDTRRIAEGRDVGNVVVQRRVGDGMEDVVHDVTFAFVFHAFRPDGVIHAE